MRLNKLLVPLAFSMLFSSGVVAASAITSVTSNCYTIVRNSNNLNVTKSMAIKLCSGVTNSQVAMETIRCFLVATAKEAGEVAVPLGLDIGSAVNLCKNNSEPF